MKNCLTGSARQYVKAYCRPTVSKFLLQAYL